MKEIFLLRLYFAVALLLPVSASAEDPNSCTEQSLRPLPDVRITSVTPEATPAPHCKVAGIIGTETHFELLLPENWKTGTASS
jgi:feruloyl esterase